MKTRKTLWVLACSLGLAAGLATAQNNPPKEDSPKPGMHSMHEMGHEMGAWRMKHHLQKLKTELKLSAEQEPAWAALSASMTPPARPPRPDHAEMEKLPVPERLEKMKQLMEAHHAVNLAQMDKHMEAVKTFYAQLSAEQKKVFDAKAMPSWMHGPHHG
jgi:hypothetical protein